MSWYLLFRRGGSDSINTLLHYSWLFCIFIRAALVSLFVDTQDDGRHDARHDASLWAIPSQRPVMTHLLDSRHDEAVSLSLLSDSLDGVNSTMNFQNKNFQTTHIL